MTCEIILFKLGLVCLTGHLHLLKDLLVNRKKNLPNLVNWAVAEKQERMLWPHWLLDINHFVPNTTIGGPKCSKLWFLSTHQCDLCSFVLLVQRIQSLSFFFCFFFPSFLSWNATTNVVCTLIFCRWRHVAPPRLDFQWQQECFKHAEISPLWKINSKEWGIATSENLFSRDTEFMHWVQRMLLCWMDWMLRAWSQQEMKAMQIFLVAALLDISHFVFLWSSPDPHSCWCSSHILFCMKRRLIVEVHDKRSFTIFCVWTEDANWLQPASACPNLVSQEHSIKFCSIGLTPLTHVDMIWMPPSMFQICCCGSLFTWSVGHLLFDCLPQGNNNTTGLW